MRQEVKVGIVVYESCTSSMVTGFWDLLSLANQLHRQDHGTSLFCLELIGKDKSPINSFSGLAFTAHKTIRAKSDYDLIYVPGFMGDVEAILEKEQKIIQWLRVMHGSGVVLSAACNGNFLLGASGVLDHKKATTHWNLASKFRDKYKAVILQPDRIIVDNGNIISAAGVTAYLNLGLHIIQRFSGPGLSLFCAKIFLVDAGRKIQTPYQISHFSKNHNDENIGRAQDWLENNYKEKFSLDRLANLVGLTPKTLLRRFKKATGETPQIYLQKFRIETAKRLLESKDITFNEVTWDVGYNDVSAFHKVFKQETGLTPIKYREKFYLA
jgi:transcriptional regulator GlxA family with amidase domain